MIQFDSDLFDAVARKLSPYIEFGLDGETRDEPWHDDDLFRAWLADHQILPDVQEFLFHHLPRVGLHMNHGCLFGIERFMERNGDSRHQVLRAGFIILGSGPNGDFIVMDVGGGAGKTGWLPMAMIWGMSAAEIREHFVGTNATVGEFMRASDENWDAVPKDWYDARDSAGLR